MIMVCAFVDPVGSFNTTPDQEYDEIKEFIEKRLDREVIFKKNIPPWNMLQQPCDCYVIDYGGISYGCHDTVTSMFRCLLKKVNERPNTLFIIWSIFSERFFDEAVEAECSDFNIHNVIFKSRDSDIFIEKLQSWFSVGTNSKINPTP